ncbi:MAG: hypothetical protein C0522_13625 [Rhodocyclaceae bacterium]|nr:hypothetical protein [Rhodocyclaceae bacterium]
MRCGQHRGACERRGQQGRRNWRNRHRYARQKSRQQRCSCGRSDTRERNRDRLRDYRRDQPGAQRALGWLREGGTREDDRLGQSTSRRLGQGLEQDLERGRRGCRLGRGGKRCLRQADQGQSHGLRRVNGFAVARDQQAGQVTAVGPGGHPGQQNFDAAARRQGPAWVDCEVTPGRAQ